VSALESEVLQQEMQRSILIPSTNLDAWSAYHRGLSHMYRFRTKSCDSAEKFFRQSIDLESNLPRPYSGLSFVNYERAYLNLEGSRGNFLRRSVDYALQAIDIDPVDPMGHWALSRARFLEGDIGAARESVMLSTELNPSYATAQYFLGWIAMQSGDHELCQERIDFARRLSPYDPLIYGMLGVSALSLVLMGRNEEALQRVDEALKHPDVHHQAHAWGVAIFNLVGRPDRANDSLKRVLTANPDYDIQEFFSVHAFQNDDDVRQITQAFKDAKRHYQH
jgi:tetratricopeptide (TPR) repeat protein